MDKASDKLPEPAGIDEVEIEYAPLLERAVLESGQRPVCYRAVTSLRKSIGLSIWRKGSNVCPVPRIVTSP